MLAAAGTILLLAHARKPARYAHSRWLGQSYSYANASFPQLYLRPAGGCFAVYALHSPSHASSTGLMEVYDSSGRLLKRIKLNPGQGFSHGSQDPQGNLYLGGNHAGRVYAFGPDGEERWRCDIPPAGSAGPQITAKTDVTCVASVQEGNIYVISLSGVYSVLSAEGKVIKRCEVGELLSTNPQPAVTKEGGLYAIAAQGDLLHVATGGRVLWRNNVGRSLSALRTLPDGALCAVQDGKSLACINPDGKLRWQFTGQPAQTFGAMNLDPIIYTYYNSILFVSSRESLCALNDLGQVKWQITSASKFSRPFVKDGRVYAQNSTDTVVSRYDLWAEWKNYSQAWHLPKINASNLPHVSVFTCDDGQRVEDYILPDGAVLSRGPGSQGEFYGIQFILAGKAQLSYAVACINLN